MSSPISVFSAKQGRAFQKTAVHTYIVGLVAVMVGLTCLSGFGVFAGTIWKDPSQADSNAFVLSPDSVSEKAKRSNALSCEESCAERFNYCKFSEKKAEEICSAQNATCLLACPVLKDEELISYGGTPPFPEGGSIDGMGCVEGESVLSVDPRVSYIIVTRQMFVAPLEPFIAAKRSAGERVETVLLERIVCSEPGQDVPEKLRHYLIRLHQSQVGKKERTKVLLVGAPRKPSNHVTATLANVGNKLKEPWEVPMRYVAGLAGYAPIPSDQYYASLNEAWNTQLSEGRSSGLNELNEWQTTFDFNVQFLVGRVPVRNATDLSNWIYKTLRWRTPVAFKESKFVSANCPVRAPDFLDAWESSSTHKIESHACQTDEGGDIVTYANRELPDLVSSYSHGSVTGITNHPLPNGYTMTTRSSGFTKPPVLFVHGCEVGGLDYRETSLAETYIARRDGVVAFIGSTRSHYDDPFLFQQQVFHKGYASLGEAFYSAKANMVLEEHLPFKSIDNLFMFSLYGDPGLVLIQPSLTLRSTPSFVHVPAVTHAEPFSRTVRVTSRLDEELRGGLYHENSTSEEGRVAPRATTSLTLRGISPQLHPLIPRLDHALPSNVKPIQFSSPNGTACDTSRMTCVASDLRIVPPVYLSCARLARTIGWVGETRTINKTAEVKLMGSSLSSTPLTFALSLYPGTYLTFMRGVDEFTRRTPVQVARMRIAYPISQTVYRFSFSETPISTPYSGEREGSYYTNPKFKVEAFDDAGNRKGWCWYNGWEPDVEGVFDGFDL